jgi:deoxyribodipyrimidine photolyase-related protein
MGVPHWLFGDQLGPHFLTGRSGTPVVMIEARSVFRRRRFHRAKAHLVLSAMRHRAAELGDRVRYVRAETYREGLREAVGDGPVTVRHPTSYAALRLVRSLESRDSVTVLPARGFLVAHDDFRAWADGHGGQRLRQEDFYRWVRRSHDLLMDGDRPAGDRWNHDHDNREPPPKVARTLGAPPPYRPTEDEIDDEVRRDLDRWEREGSVAFVGRDGPRLFPATRREARAALRRFVEHRLAGFGPHEDAMLAGDLVMSHSLLSSSLNLGLLDPAECVERAEAAWRAGRAPVNSVEGFVRQVAGWREYVWQLYWYFGEDYRHRNALRHHEPLPGWFLELDADAVRARCLATVLAQVRDTAASSTRTPTPAASRSRAHASPATPAPTTSTSVESVGFVVSGAGDTRPPLPSAGAAPCRSFTGVFRAGPVHGCVRPADWAGRVGSVPLRLREGAEPAREPIGSGMPRTGRGDEGRGDEGRADAGLA